MKKIQLVQIINLIWFCVYVVLIVLNFWVGNSNKLIESLFTILLAVISLNLIYKGKLLKSTSTLWFGLNLMIYAIMIIAFNLLKLSIFDYNWLMVLLPILPSIMIIGIFYNLIYVKVIIFNIAIAIPIIIDSIFNIDLWKVLVIALISVMLAIVISRSISIGKESV